MRKETFLKINGFNYESFKLQCLEKGYKVSKSGSHFFLKPLQEIKMSLMEEIKKQISGMLKENNLRFVGFYIKPNQDDFKIIEKIELK